MDGYLSDGLSYGSDTQEDYAIIRRDYGSSNDSLFEFEDAGEVVTFGKLVERSKLKNKKTTENKGNDSGLEKVKRGGSNTDEMWITLPSEVMVSILARLPFSDFCSFRCVCKKWSALIVYPDPTLMIMGDSLRQVPVCVMYTGLNQFASYNPSLHSWHHMPVSFGSSFGVLGFNCDETRVVAGCSRFLVLESLHTGLWVVNPINKTERSLPPLPRDTIQHRVLPSDIALHRGSIRSVHIQLDEGRSSFKIAAVYEITYTFESLPGDTGIPGLEILVYDSTSDSWDPSHDLRSRESCHVLSTVVFEGEICCLVLREAQTHLYDFCDICTMKHYPYQDYNGEYSTNLVGAWCCDTLPQPPKRLAGGQFFFKDGDLSLGGVTFMLREDQTFYCAHIWRLNDDNSAWHEVARMPVELMDELSFHFGPHVAIDGDYMWVTDFALGHTKMDLSQSGFGVMCHLPSYTWWKLPSYSDSPMRILNPQHSEQRELYAEVCSYFSQTDHHGTCPPFLFNPRMDLEVQET